MTVKDLQEQLACMKDDDIIRVRVGTDDKNRFYIPNTITSPRTVQGSRIPAIIKCGPVSTLDAAVICTLNTN